MTSASTWKGKERRLAKRYGATRHPSPHGPDYIYVGHRDGKEFKLQAEVKLRTNPPIVLVESYLNNGRDILWVGRKGDPDTEALVVMRVSIFDEFFDTSHDE